MIVRASRKNTFTVVNNIVLNDDRLTFRAKGILVFILSKPDDWRVSERNLAEQGPDGRSAIASALTELEHAGYLRRTRTRQPDGTFQWDSLVFDEPQPFDAPQTITAPEIDADNTVEPVAKIAAEITAEPAIQVDRCDPGGSQRSTMAGKTVHGLTVRGKPSQIINTEQLKTEHQKRDDDNEIANRATPSSSSSSIPTPPAISATAPTQAGDSYQAVRAVYEQNFGLLTPILSERIKTAVAAYPAEWLLQAMERAVAAEKRRWDYVEGILRNWQTEGFQQRNTPRPSQPATRPSQQPIHPAAMTRTADGFDDWLAELSRTDNAHLHGAA